MFDISYRERVVKDDIPKLSKIDKDRVKKAIDEKLVHYPVILGKPLRQSLSGYRKLRVGDYRVIFCIKGKRVVILAILHRSIVYKKFSKN